MVGTKQANLQWLEMRKQELLADDPSLSQEAALRLLEEGLKELPEQDAKFEMVGIKAVLLGVVIACGMGYLVYNQVGAYEDLAITARLQTLTDSSSDSEVQELVAQIEARLEQRPDNTVYLGLLGGYYMGQGAYPKASQVYAHMVELMPESPQILAYAAQARYLSNNRQFDERGRLWAEQAVSLNPRQATALGLLGMAAFESGEYAEAIEHWRVLRAMNGSSSPESNVLDDLLAQAEQALGTDDSPAEPDHAGALVLTVEFTEVPQQTSGTVFVVIRPEGVDRGMPLAVRRLALSDLPAKIVLTDLDSMAGQKLSSQAAVSVSAHLSLTGSASSEGAPYKSPSIMSVPVGAEQPISIRLAPAQ
jgi:cytochrome c-type biogenesis protein CcmH